MNIRPQQRFSEAGLVSYGLISVDSDRIGCDWVAHDLSEFGIKEYVASSVGVSFNVVARNSSKFGTQGNSNCKQCLILQNLWINQQNLLT